MLELMGFYSEHILLFTESVFPEVLKKGNKMVHGVKKWSRGKLSFLTLFLMEKYILRLGIQICYYQNFRNNLPPRASSLKEEN